MNIPVELTQLRYERLQRRIESLRLNVTNPTTGSLLNEFHDKFKEFTSPSNQLEWRPIGRLGPMGDPTLTTAHEWLDLNSIPPCILVVDIHQEFT